MTAEGAAAAAAPWKQPDGRRTMGLQRPFHSLQLLSWAVFGSDVFFFAALGLPLIAKAEAALMVSVVYAISVVLLLVAAFAATKMDPMDPRLEGQEAQQEAGKVDPTSRAYCISCQGHVHPRSKHCRECNKCVETFDHHCMWLNNCIGARNYRAFLGTIVSVAAMVGIVLGTCIYLLHNRFAAEDLLEKRMQELPFYRLLPTGFVFAVLIVLLLVNLPLFVLDVHLIFLHLFLMSQQLTTYEYIMIKQGKLEPNPSRTVSSGRLVERIKMLPSCLDWIFFARCCKKRRKASSGARAKSNSVQALSVEAGPGTPAKSSKVEQGASPQLKVVGGYPAKDGHAPAIPPAGAAGSPPVVDVGTPPKSALVTLPPGATADSADLAKSPFGPSRSEAATTVAASELTPVSFSAADTARLAQSTACAAILSNTSDIAGGLAPPAGKAAVAAAAAAAAAVPAPAPASALAAEEEEAAADVRTPAAAAGVAEQSVVPKEEEGAGQPRLRPPPLAASHDSAKQQGVEHDLPPVQVSTPAQARTSQLAPLKPPVRAATRAPAQQLVELVALPSSSQADAASGGPKAEKVTSRGSKPRKKPEGGAPGRKRSSPRTPRDSGRSARASALSCEAAEEPPEAAELAVPELEQRREGMEPLFLEPQPSESAPTSLKASAVEARLEVDASV